MKRGLRIGDLEITVSKITEISIPGPGRIYLDELEDGTWRLVYTKDTFPEGLKDIKEIAVIREEVGDE